MTAPAPVVSAGMFVKKSRDQFVEYSTLWVEHMEKLFPECQETKDCKIFFENVVAHSESQLTEQIRLWHEGMQAPLNVKYGKAIERITSSPARVYHALTYRDITALRDNIKSATALRVDLFGKYEQVDDEQKLIIWRFMDKITSAAYEALESKLPVVPLRAAIHENILNRKDKSSDDAPSMAKAFQTHVNALCKQLGSVAVLEGATDASVGAWMHRWHEFAKDSTGGEKMTALCANQDARALHALVGAFPELARLEDPGKVDEKVWKNIAQLNGFSSVTGNIPQKMMGRIEEMASKLADDIVAGRTDMASVNLTDIGQQVLSGCNEDDMSKFANNIEELLPALQTFQAQRTE
mgnify:CR=1 FL=1